jgi:hypothetical protein
MRGLVPFGRLPRFVYLLSKQERIVEPGSDRQSSNSPNASIKLNDAYVNVNILTRISLSFVGIQLSKAVCHAL